jgi:hypothetical protein
MRSSPCFRCFFLFLCLALLAAPASAGPGEVAATGGWSLFETLWEAVLDAIPDTDQPEPEEPDDEPDDGGDLGSELDPNG